MDLERFLKAQQQQEYISNMRPVFRKRALFSDTTENYVIPQEPRPYEEITIRFRSAKDNIDRVYFVHAGQKELMLFESTDGEFDYYSVPVQLENELLAYYFEIECGHIDCCYDMRGTVREADERFYFRIYPGFSTPSWAKGAVMYQIFVDRFCNGDETNDVQTGEYCYIGEPVVKANNWNDYPDSMDVRRFYGGDLQGVMDKLDYLQDLGVEVIYLNPIFVSPSNHKYDIQDYDYIDPHFGRIVKEEGELLGEGQRENRFAFWTAYSITAVRLINGWTVSAFMKMQKAIRRALMLMRTVPIVDFSIFMKIDGLIIIPTTAGGDMIHCQS